MPTRPNARTHDTVIPSRSSRRTSCGRRCAAVLDPENRLIYFYTGRVPDRAAISSTLQGTRFLVSRGFSCTFATSGVSPGLTCLLRKNVRALRFLRRAPTNYSIRVADEYIHHRSAVCCTSPPDYFAASRGASNERRKGDDRRGDHVPGEPSARKTGVLQGNGTAYLFSYSNRCALN